MFENKIKKFSYVSVVACGELQKHIWEKKIVINRELVTIS